MARIYRPLSAEPARPRGDIGPAIFFCPVGLAPNGAPALCRLRLHPCAGFSDTMPLRREAAAARSTIIVLLFWRVPHGDIAVATSTIVDWKVRMAELRHLPVPFRPHTVVLAFDADEEQASMIQEFVEEHAPVVQSSTSFIIADEDVAAESLRGLADEAIASHAKVMSFRWSKSELVQKGCCAMM